MMPFERQINEAGLGSDSSLRISQINLLDLFAGKAAAIKLAIEACIFYLAEYFNMKQNQIN
jgi:hypothetical protein